MMNRTARTLWATAAFFSVLRPCLAGPVTIQYEVEDIGAGRWEYTYEVANNALAAPVEEFTIWFEFGRYENLMITTPDPPGSGWDELLVQPDPILTDDGFYDALSLTGGVPIGETITGFGVSFDWLAAGDPGAQLVEVIDPATFDTLYSGSTVPEPTTLVLLGVLLPACIRRARNRHVMSGA